MRNLGTTPAQPKDGEPSRDRPERKKNGPKGDPFDPVLCTRALY